jgi:inner membrane protein
MASIFGHALASVAIGSNFSKNIKTIQFWLLGMFCAIFPDADVIGFKFGIKYGSFFGHRGFTHSFVFALLFGFLVTLFFYRKKKNFIWYVLFFVFATASHPILDAMTTGGLGVAFFSPFDNTRYFFPWRPIKVSPIGASKFFSTWGLRVIKSELLWIGLPSFILIIVLKLMRIIFRR